MPILKLLIMENKHELDGLKGECNYRGCLVRRIIGGFDIWGLKFSTGIEVDEAIDNAGTILSESIERGKSVTVDASGGANTCQNTEKVGR